MQTYYVTIQHTWQTKKKRWSTRLGVGTEEMGSWYWRDNPNLLAVFQLRATSKDEAIGIIAEYLLLGQPKYMVVKELYRRSGL